MDYFHKYQKYKAKYLELKNNQIAGSTNYDMHNSNIKLLKKIGDGWSGLVYKCKIGDKDGIYKIEKIENINDEYKSNYNRQVDFSISVGNKYPDLFLTLEQSGIIYDCNYESNIPKNMPNYLKKEKIKSNKIKTCSYLAYTPILDGTLRKIISFLSNTQYKKMVNDILKSIDIMHSNGYYHRDIHDENIMYKKIGNDYHWYIIDYGLICHKKYQSNDTDKLVSKKNWENDKIAFIYSILNKPILDYVEEKGLRINNFDDRVKYIKKQKEYSDIKLYIPSNLNKKETKEIIIILTIILHNNIFIKSLGLDYDKYKKKDKIQRDNKFLLNLIKNI